MLEYSSEEVLKAFSCSSNINAALKKVLKQEIQKGDPGEKFIKTLRSKLSSVNNKAAGIFIDNSIPEYEDYLFVAADYGLSEVTGTIADKIVADYAEEFNTTYDSDEKKIKVKDRDNFNRIVSEVMQLIESSFKEHDLPVSGFTKSMMIYRIFDEPVMKEVVKVVG